MPATRARRARAPPFIDPPGYVRHRPEGTLLYRLVEQHYPAFRELRAGLGRPLPEYVEQEFDAYLKCGRLEEGFLRLRCEHCHAEKLVAFSCKKRGFCPSCGARRIATRGTSTTGAVAAALNSMVVRTEGACRLDQDVAGQAKAALDGGAQRDQEMNDAGGGRTGSWGRCRSLKLIGAASQGDSRAGHKIHSPQNDSDRNVD